MPTADVPPMFFTVAADPVRWRLLGELARSDRRVGELTALLGKPQSVVSYHLAELRGAGLVSSRRSSADGRDTYYRLNVAGCRQAIASAEAALPAGLRSAPFGISPERPVARSRQRVLFLCTGNSARSQMAEALLVHRSGGACEARSAGSHPKPIHPLAVSTMARRGIDIGGCASKHLNRFRSTRFDRVITVCDKVREICPQFPRAAVVAHWSVADPSAQAPEVAASAFDAIADELTERVDALISELSET